MALSQKDVEMAKKNSKPSVLISRKGMSLSAAASNQEGDGAEEELLLSNVSFALEASTTTAVLGPTGAGKTLLLQALAGRLDSSFLVRTNGESDKKKDISEEPQANAAVAPDAQSDEIAYVPPNDVVLGHDTPREAIMFRHQLRFGSDSVTAEQASIDLENELGLSQCCHNVISPGAGLRGISGGQRRRTCMAMALVARPKVLLLDEPTTGLDSNTARQVVEALREISRKHSAAVMFSLQQPSSDLFRLFDNVLIFDEEGRQSYFGPLMGAPPPVPAHVSLHWEDLQKTNNNDSNQDTQTEDTAAVAVDDEEATNDKEEEETNNKRNQMAQVERDGQSSVLRTSVILFNRNVRIALRNPLAIGMRAAQSVLLGIFLGLVFLNTDFTPDNFKQVFGLFFCMVASSLVPVETGACIFPLEEDIVVEEQRLPFRYNSLLYSAIKFITESIFQLPLALLFGVIVGALVGYEGETYGRFCMTMMMQAAASEAFGFLISTLAPPSASVSVIVPTAAISMAVVGTGLTRPDGALEVVVRVLEHIAFLSYGFKAVASDALRTVHGNCTKPNNACLFPSGQAALEYHKLENIDVGEQWAILAAFAIGFRILGGMAIFVLGWRAKVSYSKTQRMQSSSSKVSQRPREDNKHDDGELMPAAVVVPLEHLIATQAKRLAHLLRPFQAKKDVVWDVEFKINPRFGPDRGEWRTILHRMQGRANAGRTLAVMGGSGAGKSTLVEALTKRLPPTGVFTITDRSEAKVYLAEYSSSSSSSASSNPPPSSHSPLDDTILEEKATEEEKKKNNNNKTERPFADNDAYEMSFVYQDQAFIVGLTAFETLVATMKMRFNSETIAAEEKEGGTTAEAGDKTDGGVIDTIAKELVDFLAIPPDCQVENLKSNEKKRLLIAQGLAMRNSIILLDEPTSGLDAEMSHRVLQLLHHLAHDKDSSTTVIFTLHQPGEDLLPFIDDLLLLADGHVVYHGSLDDADETFTKISGQERSPGLTKTEHYLELAADKASVGKLIRNAVDVGPYEPAAAEEEEKGGDNEKSPSPVAATSAPNRPWNVNSNAYFSTLLTLIHRSAMTTFIRAPKVPVLSRFVILFICLPVIIGLTFFQIDKNSPTAIADFQGTTFILQMALSFTATIIPVLDVSSDRLVYQREQLIDLYSPEMYLTARCIASLPVDLFGGLLASLIAYFMTGFEADAGAFFTFYASLILCQQAMIGAGFALSILFDDLVVSAALVAMIQIGVAVGQGVIISPENIDSTRWMHSMEFISPNRQSMLIQIKTQMKYIPNGEVLVSDVLGFGRAIDEPVVLWTTLAVLLVLYRISAYVMFRLVSRRGKY